MPNKNSPHDKSFTEALANPKDAAAELSAVLGRAPDPQIPLPSDDAIIRSAGLGPWPCFWTVRTVRCQGNAFMAKRTYGAEIARTLLPELLERAHQGLSSLITKRGKPYAALVPVGQMRRTRQAVLALRGSGRGLWGKDSARTIRDLRDEWS